jgi:hypothetical protein
VSIILMSLCVHNTNEFVCRFLAGIAGSTPPVAKAYIADVTVYIFIHMFL